jgi:hypothetical protein
MMNDETMSTQQKTDAHLILHPRVEREWVHFDWAIYVDGRRQALYRSSSSRLQRDDGPLFPSFECRKAAQWLVSEDKKRFRSIQATAMGGLWDQEITLEMIKRNIPSSSNWYDRTQYSPRPDHWNITDFAVLPVRVCPRTGLVWWKNTDVFSWVPRLPLRRVFLLSILRKPLSGVIIGGGFSDLLKGFIFSPSSKAAGPTFLSGDRFHLIKVALGLKQRDPRAFLYEKKERIRKSQIVTFISRRIRKISKIRPVSKSEKFFFQALIGAKRLMDLVAA